MTTQTKLIKEEAQKMLEEHIQELENYDHYRMELDPEDENPSKTIAELIRDADIDCIDFNIGFEQGYMRSLEELLNKIACKERLSAMKLK
jgi:hypothetical protein